MRISFFLILILLSSGCSALIPVGRNQAADQGTVYQPADPGEGALSRHAPLFVVEESGREFNRIGAPVAIARKESGGTPAITIDTGQPVLYAEERTFATAKGRYRNLIYRVHFPGVPFSLLPFHLTAGPGAGLIVILTLDQAGTPLLAGMVHTCGCFLTMIPTSYLDPGAYPPGWSTAGQKVYGISLPGRLDYARGQVPGGNRLILTVESGTHRISGVRLGSARDALLQGDPVRLPIRPMADLEHLRYEGGEISFFEGHGPRKGHARNSLKPLEALLMGWWALDPYVGQDKALGPREKTGAVFYTSLKFMAREASDMGDYATFLRYWSWGL